MKRDAPIEEKRAYSRAYYAKNKDKLKAYFKVWRAEHQNEERERSKLKYQKTKETCRIRNLKAAQR